MAFEILLLDRTPTGLDYRVATVDVTRRRDLLRDPARLGALVEERYRQLVPAARAASREGLLIHSTSWRQAADGTVVLTWAVLSPLLRDASRDGWHHLETGPANGTGATTGAATPPRTTADRAALHGAAHIGFLARHDAAIAALLDRAPGGAASWLSLRASAAGELEPAPSAEGMRPAAAPRGTGWRVVQDVYTVDVAPPLARCAARSVDCSEQRDAAAGHIRLRDIAAATQLPDAATARGTLLRSTSWALRDGALHCHWMAIPVQADLRGQPIVTLRLDCLGIPVTDDVTRPGSTVVDDVSVISHGLENLGHRALDEPSTIAALDAVPGRLAAMRAVRVARHVTAAAIERPASDEANLG